VVRDTPIGFLTFAAGNNNSAKTFAKLPFTTTAATYQATWTPPYAGTFDLSVKPESEGQGAFTIIRVLGNEIPSVLLNPVGGTGGALIGQPTVLSAAVADLDGTITLVEFYANGQRVASSANPISGIATASWIPNLAGTVSLTAKVTDNRGAVNTSSPIQVTVTGNAPPVVSLINPSATGSFATGQPVELKATAMDSDGTITKIEFIANGAVVGIVNNPPVGQVTTYRWTPSAGGGLRVKCKGYRQRWRCN
jgi:Bacterial Ig domain